MEVTPVTDALGTTGSAAPVPTERAPEQAPAAVPQEAPLPEYEGTKVDTTA